MNRLPNHLLLPGSSGTSMERPWSTTKGAMRCLSNVEGRLVRPISLCTSSQDLGAIRVLQTRFDSVVAPLREKLDGNLRCMGCLRSQMLVCPAVCLSMLAHGISCRCL